MLSVEKIKELLKDKNTSSKEAEDVRNGCLSLAEIIFEEWEVDKKAKKR